VQAIESVVGALAETGEFDRAVALARSLTDDTSKAWALANVAASLASARRVGEARLLIASACGVGPWEAPLSVVGSLQPGVLLALAGDIRGGYGD